MQDIFDLKGYINKLATTINETCDNARNALNILMGISVVMGGLILGVDDEILFLDQGATVPYAGIPITVSTVFFIFPMVYLVIYGLLCLKLLSITTLIKKFTTTRDILIKKTQSELLYPLSQENDRLLKNAPNTYNDQLKSFFFLDSLLHKNTLATIISYILLYCVPLAVLIKAMLVFLPYQSWIISISHWIVILIFTGLFIYLIRIVEKQEKHHCDPTKQSCQSNLNGSSRHCEAPQGLWQSSLNLLKTMGFKILKTGLLRFARNDRLYWFYETIGYILIMPIFFCVCSAVALYDRMDNGKIDYPFFLYFNTALDLSHKILVKKPTSDGILAVAYEKDLQDKDKTHFKQAQWKYAEGYFLRNRSFKGIDLSYATAYKIDLTGSDLSNSILFNSKLNGANFNDIILLGTPNIETEFLPKGETIIDLTDANLSYANFTNTNLSNANLTRTNFSNANLEGVNLSNTLILNSNFSNAKCPKYNGSTIFLGSIIIGSDLSNFNCILQLFIGENTHFDSVDLSNQSIIYKPMGSSFKDVLLFGTKVTLYKNLFNDDLSQYLSTEELIDSTIQSTIYNSKKFLKYPPAKIPLTFKKQGEVIDICTEIIPLPTYVSGTHFVALPFTFIHETLAHLTKRKKVGNGYDYSAYCVD